MNCMNNRLFQGEEFEQPVLTPHTLLREKPTPVLEEDLETIVLFSLVGMPAHVHSDREASFMSRELREFLSSKVYNREGNGQAERCTTVIWKAVTMSLKSNNLPHKNWQDVLPDVLHSVRSLLCTATSQTPHEQLFGFSRQSSPGASIST